MGEFPGGRSLVITVVVELGVLEESDDGWRGFDGHGGCMRSRLRVEREGAVVQHKLGIIGRRSLDAEITEHCVRFPATEEHDGVGANVGA